MSSDSTPSAPRDFSQLVASKIEEMRPKLLDLSARNPLISMPFNARGASQARVVDELPDRLFFSLSNEQRLDFKPLPSLEEDSKDELSPTFSEAYAIALRTDESYFGETVKLDPEALDHDEQLRRLERGLKDRVRDQLGMPKRVTRKDEPLAQHAKNHGINPNFDLPDADAVADDERFDDSHIQTMVLAPDLERKLNGLITKGKTWQQETGLNLVRGAFGFLEWKDPARSDGRTYMSPLVLLPVTIDRRKTAMGPIFSVEGSGDDAETNLVLREKMRREFSIELPLFEGGSLEKYFSEIAEIKHAKLPWRVRRQIVFGLFPAARMAMYEDLDTTLSDFSKNEVVQTLLVGSETSSSGAMANEYDVDAPEIEAEVPYLVKKADASQFSVLVDLAKGKNLAVEGPPGTGKSDTIVNAIAAALAKGKKVLFVAEKAAALHVVQARLEDVGLGDFVLPLLAGKSTREDVMNSIRARMAASESMPRDFRENRDRYVAVRDKLARYVGILGSEWEGTGTTVHHVVGSAIAKQARLDPLSPSSLAEHRLPDRHYREHEIAALIDAAARIEVAENTSDALRPYWRGTRCLDTSTFKINEIQVRALRAAEGYRALEKASIGFAAFGVAAPNVAQAEKIATLSSDFTAKIPAQMTSADAPLLTTLDAANIARFLSRCLEAQRSAGVLAKLIVDPTDPAAVSTLGRIAEVCSEEELGSLDATDVSVQIEFLDATLEALSKVAQAVRTFISQVPPAASWTAGDVRKARLLVDETPRSILDLRSAVVSESSGISALRVLLKRASELASTRREVSEFISLKQKTTAAMAENAHRHIKQAGTFSFLSGDFKEAKAFYLSISKANKFEKGQALLELEMAMAYLDEEAKFNERAMRSAVFGTWFDGLDTDFSAFEKLADFQERIDKEFAGFEARDIRALLKSGDHDILSAIPEAVGLNGDLRLAEIDSMREQSKAKLARLRETVETLKPLRAALVSGGNSLNAGDLPNLKAELQSFQLASSELDLQHLADLGRRFAGWRTAVAEVQPFLEAANVLLVSETLGDVVRSAYLRGDLNGLRLAAKDVTDKTLAATASLGEASTEASCNLADAVVPLPPNEAAEYLAAAAADRDGLEIQIAIAKARADISLHGLLETTDLLRRQLDSWNGVGPTLESLVRRAAAGRVYQRFGNELSSYSGKQIESLRADLKTLDDTVRTLSRRALRSELISKSHAPHGTTRGRVAELTEMGLIEHLAGQRRIRVPVRDITKRAGRALLEMKPCWMMSPLAVAQFIPKNSIQFDVCIIDEASQMPPEDAIGALYRSHQSMVVGDTKQLPPSNFFSKVYADDGSDDEQSDAVTEESVLEMANSAFRPRRMLRWHYRSRHSKLIGFSNRVMYEDDLVVFPSANEDDASMGVFLVQTNGIYKAGLNPAEADAVVEAALSFMRSDKHRSLGIVAMNKSQADYINERIQYAIARNKSAGDYVERWNTERGGLEEFFCKNLENVQGDERDVIFISTVYGPPAEGGKTRQNFGPINGPSGKRRLNVLFTRAKEQIRTFTSMSSSDIVAEESGNAGAWMLGRWLEYSAGGPLVTGTGTHGAFDSPLEQFVADQITAMGCTPMPQIGVVGYSIDLGVRHPEWPNGFILGVECDGATYHSSKSARDRDRHRQEILENLGWKIHRIWSTDWFDNPRREAERLRLAITERLEELKRKMIIPAAMPSDGVGEALMSPLEAIVKIPMELEEARPVEPVPATAVPLSQIARVGDTVRIRYLDRAKERAQFKIITGESDPSMGVVNRSAPLAVAVLDCEVGDEVEMLIGSHIRTAMIEAVTR